MRLIRPVFITASPNTEFSDVLRALRLLISPWLWFGDKLTSKFSARLAEFLQLDHQQIFLTDSGRSGFYFFLKNLRLAQSDEVILPAFTCLAVANPVVWAGVKPVYVDIEATTFNIDLAKLEKAITEHTRVVVLQHTFGRPVDVLAVKKIIGERNILIVEDIAHSLGGELQGRKLGTIGDAAILGFGIDKTISGVRGGGIVINNSALLTSIDWQKYYRELPNHPSGLSFKALLNPIIWETVTPLYFVGYHNFTLGRLLLRILYLLGIIGNVNSDEENFGSKPTWMPARIAPVCAGLATFQLSKIAKLNAHRVALAAMYAGILNIQLDNSNQVYQKFSLLVKDSLARKALYETLKKQWILIGDWLPRPLYAKFSPVEVYKTLYFDPADFPIAMDVTSRIVNLPTGIRVGERAVNIIRKVL